MMYYRYHRVWVAAGVLAAAVFLFPLSAHALTLSPSRFENTGDPGQTITEVMVLTNETDETETYYPSYANFEAQGDSGQPVFVDPREGVGTWMQVGGAVTLRAGESKEVTLRIAIPSTADAGGHFGAVFWATTPPSQTGAVSVGSRVGALVLLSVSGEVSEAFGLVDFDTTGGTWFYRMLPVGFEYRFSNQGGDRVKPVGTITVRSLLGWRVKKLDANPFEGNVLPGTTRKFSPQWTKRDTLETRAQLKAATDTYSFSRAVKDEWHNFAIGIFRANLSMEFGTQAQRTTSSAVYFVVFPWELIVVVLPGAALVFVLLRFMLRRYNRFIIRKAHRRSQEI